jgi:hypothetical protein
LKHEAKNVAEEMMIEIEEEQKRKKRLKRKFGHGGPGAGGQDTGTALPEEDDDPMEDRRAMFGEISSESDEGKQEDCEEGDYQSDDSVKNARGGGNGACDEDEDEFMIVLQAVRERKKMEAEAGQPMN